MFFMDSKLGILLADEMKKRNLSSRDVAKIIDVSHPLIGNIINGEQPSFETCLKMASFLRLPEIEVMRIAGLIKPAPENTSEKERLIFLFDQLDANKRKDLMDYVEFLLKK